MTRSRTPQARFQTAPVRPPSAIATLLASTAQRVKECRIKTSSLRLMSALPEGFDPGTELAYPVWIDTMRGQGRHMQQGAAAGHERDQAAVVGIARRHEARHRRGDCGHEPAVLGRIARQPEVEATLRIITARAVAARRALAVVAVA